MEREVHVCLPVRTYPIALLSLFLSLFVSLGVACSDGGQDDPAQESDLREDGGRDAGRSDARADARADGAVGVGVGASAFVDPRDHQTYPTMAIGGKTWLAKNLAFASPGSFCYGDDPRNCASDGRLYPFTVARTACAPGWHLGSDDDWKSLETGLGMSASQLNLEGYSTTRGRNEGTTLKGAARMAGFRSGASYDALGDRTYFWTSTMRGGDVWRRRIAVQEPTIFRFTNPPDGFAISVRCVQD